jgi:plastocyanin
MRGLILKRVGAAIIAAGLLAGAAGTASAKPGTEHPHKKQHPANTKMGFRLDDHQVMVGDPVTGSAHLATREDHAWAPLADASLSVRVDGDEVATLTTDADGNATVSLTADTEGGHVVKVVFAGDDAHRKRQRAQGFEVEAATG